MPDWSFIYQHLEDEGVSVLRDGSPTPVSGGDISAAWRVATTRGNLFIKTGPPPVADMFSAEADGLTELLQSGAVRVPRVIAQGENASIAFLALEWLQLVAADTRIERRLGAQLADMHRTTREQFGWHRDNTIGLTAQQNTWAGNWVDFYREHRLSFQLRLAADNGFKGELQDRGAQLMKRLPIYFENTEPVASLLHGDLWGGNWGCSEGQPVIFDPAVYYGDRETDIAMTRLFGGFGAVFYEAYEDRWPLPDGHAERQHLYQLYHVLNHLNLFGSGYHGRAIALMDALL
jgi:fructosamine-3-kinase